MAALVEGEAMTVHRHRGEWPLHLAMLLASVLPVLIALLLSWYIETQRPGPIHPVSLSVQSFSSTDEIEEVFARYGYHWPPSAEVPAIAIRALPPAMDVLPPAQKKSLFFRILLPMVVAENRRLVSERQWLQGILSGRIASFAPQRLEALAVAYRLDPALPLERLLTQLLLRLDEVPAGLVLAQAANESGWGTSRFSRKANNLFGEWTWDHRQGVLPAQRPEGATHYVRRFGSLYESVRAYFNNLNSGPAYRPFRRLRAAMRKEGKPLDPVVLAEGLIHYSARGSDYVEEIQLMIRINNLNKLGPLDLVR
ncbi:MAG: glucosaminidase domain-containing protein [Gammaproteobacteria bacterium]|nr:glucosaminidase domain-containing protein [Gammaproteobacteria bacterium]MCW8959232.1 glucosaminidase domain-containing protein [Gammaproteobacteria bacterium]MCW8972847.1 glucosaminidase domain-containing protein [Gammaproteobacteria bacterium]MCW8992080.1 glucosaminidase domain-containing protein [Gammaproteobacteria bacterium]